MNGKRTVKQSLNKLDMIRLRKLPADRVQSYLMSEDSLRDDIPSYENNTGMNSSDA